MQNTLRIQRFIYQNIICPVFGLNYLVIEITLPAYSKKTRQTLADSIVDSLPTADSYYHDENITTIEIELVSANASMTMKRIRTIWRIGGG
jgi:hypothetical protein